MTVYYNALHRLKKSLEREQIGALLISTTRGQMVDTSLFDCDYYRWMDGEKDTAEAFRGEFLSEYTWGEYLIANLEDTMFDP